MAVFRDNGDMITHHPYHSEIKSVGNTSEWLLPHPFRIIVA